MIHCVKIEKIITGGFGLGRLANGQVIMSRYVLPGETVLLRETAQHRGYLEALPVEIVDRSSHRTPPPCPYFTLCGGCDFQHIEASFQHHIKMEIVRESLGRAGVHASESSVHPIIPSPQPFQYRFRIRLKVGPDGRLGFYQAGSNDLVRISRCLLATDRINEALRELNSSELFRKSAADLSEIELLQSPTDDLIFAVLHPHHATIPEKNGLDTLAASLHKIDTCLIKKRKKVQSLNGKPSSSCLSQKFDSSVCGRSFTLSWSPGCFFQANTMQNQGLVTLVREEFLKTEGGKVLELYCGMGNFSIPLALSGAEMTGIEQNSEAVRWAKFNARKYGLDRCTFQTGEVGRAVRDFDFIRQPGRFDIVLLDPPRQGLGRHIHALALLDPENIVYISCDPATLARDLAVLTKNGYSLTSLTPVDMFPQTHHIETVAVLKKN